MGQAPVYLFARQNQNSLQRLQDAGRIKRNTDGLLTLHLPMARALTLRIG